MVEIDHFDDVPLTIAVESGIVGDDGLVQFADLKHGNKVTLRSKGACA